MPYSTINKTQEMFSQSNIQPKEWQFSMLQAPCNSPLWCCVGCLCSCCAAGYQRNRILEELNMNYRCCGGNCCCMDTPEMPKACLILEACCCVGFCVMGSRDMIILNFKIQLDYIDEYLISCAAYLRCLMCILQLAGVDVPEEVETLIDILAYSILGCAFAQQRSELDFQLPKLPKGFQGKYFSEMVNNPQSGSGPKV